LHVFELPVFAPFALLLPLTGGLGGVAPVLLPDVPVATVLLCAALNPVTLAVAYLLGSKADQWAKILVAAFAGALAGAMALWIGTLLRIDALATPGRAAAGIFAVGIVFALIPAAIGYVRRTDKSTPNQ
jgi:hypothetical protein